MMEKRDCPNCGGAGYTIKEGIGCEAGCCGNPLPSGECCGNAVPVPVQIQEQEQCQWCYEYDQLAKAANVDTRNTVEVPVSVKNVCQNCVHHKNPDSADECKDCQPGEAFFNYEPKNIEVPVEPTEERIQKGIDAYEFRKDGDPRIIVWDVYKAMISTRGK